jgi:hypothetical protein
MQTKFLAEMYRKKLPKANVGVGCIRFKKLEDIDLKVMKQMVREAASVS